MLAQLWRSLDHLLGRAENLPGLLLSSGTGIDFGAELSVRGEHVDAKAAADDALAVLARHKDQQGSVAPRAILLAQPSERDADREQLPRLQLDQFALACPFALCMGQQLQEFCDLLSLCWLEFVRIDVFRLPLKIVQMLLAEQLDPTAGQDLAGDNRPRVILRLLHQRIFRF